MTPHTRRPLGWLLAVTCMLVGAAVVPASAVTTSARLGSVHFEPQVGTDETANGRATSVSDATAGTAPGCPAGATWVSLTVVGPAPWDKATQMGRTPTRPGADSEVPLSKTFAAAGVQLGGVVPGRYDLTMSCTNNLGSVTFGHFDGSIWFVDSHNYQSTDPTTTTTVTSLALSDDPPGRSDLGGPVVLVATVTPSTAVGVVRFVEVTGGAASPLGEPVPLTQGRASEVTSAFDFGLHLVRAEFVPIDPKRFKASANPAPDLVHVIAKPIPPYIVTTPTITGVPNPGSLVTCTAATKGGDEVLWTWALDATPIQGATSQGYTVVAADQGHRLSCRVTASNAGGQISAASPPILVAGGKR